MNISKKSVVLLHAFIMPVIRANCDLLFSVANYEIPENSTDEYDILKPIGFIQCAKQCLEISECQSIQYNKVQISCILSYHSNWCNDINESSCLSRDDVKEMNFNFPSQPECPPFHRLILLSSGTSKCISDLSKVWNKTIHMYNEHDMTLLNVAGCLKFVIMFTVPGPYRIQCESTEEWIFMRYTFNVGLHSVSYQDQQWNIFHHNNGSVMFRNMLYNRCLGKEITGVNCTENDTTLLWKIIIL